MSLDPSRAAALWAQADSLREKGERLKDEGESLCRAAERMNALAAAVADGRDADTAEIARDMAGRP
jgi:hypothetical protein